jgi:hypothetical protein
LRPANGGSISTSPVNSGSPGTDVLGLRRERRGPSLGRGRPGIHRSGGRRRRLPRGLRGRGACGRPSKVVGPIVHRCEDRVLSRNRRAPPGDPRPPGRSRPGSVPADGSQRYAGPSHRRTPVALT